MLLPFLKQGVVEDLYGLGKQSFVDVDKSVHIELPGKRLEVRELVILG